jgi:hypothetical protein
LFPVLAAQHSGSVRFAGQVVPGATVTATLGDKKLVTATGENGTYAFEELPPGTWLIEVDMFGFKKQEKSLLVEAQPATLDWELELKERGAAPAPAAATIATQAPSPQTQKPAPSRNRTAAQSRKPGETGYRTLALNAETDGLEASTAEPPPSGPANSEEYAATESFMVTGSLSQGLGDARRDEARDYRRGEPGDRFSGPGSPPGFGMGMGTDPSAGPPPGFGPETASMDGGRGGGRGGGGPGGPGGRGGGGDSGGRRRGGPSRSRSSIGNRRQRNQIQGSVYWSLRNSALDARPYSLSGQPEAKPSYAQSRFGASAGGALRIPKVFESDSTFFYFNYTGNQSRSPYNSVATLPSPLERSGDFSQSVARGPVTIYDPLSNLPFAGNIIPQSRINPAAAGLLSFIPARSFASAVQNYQYLTSVPSTSNNFGIRLNQTISRRDRLTFNVNTQSSGSQSSSAFGFRDASAGSGLSSSAGFSHNFGSRITNSLTWTLSRSRNASTPYFAGKADVEQQLGISGASSDPRNWGPPNLSFTNFGGLSDGTPSVRRSQTSMLSEGLSMVKKKHTLTFGGSLRRMQINNLAENGRGSFSFSGLETSGFNSSGQPLAGTGFDFADFLLGFPQSSSIRFGSANTYFRAQAYSGYVNDDWRLKRSFSVSLGLRYEYFTPFTEKYGKIANLDIAPGFTGVAVVTPGQTGPYTGAFPNALINDDKKLFSPRTGIAWRPLKSRALVVRAGYGLFFNGSIYNQFPSQLASQPPFATTGSATTSTADVLTLQNGFADTSKQNITNTYAVDKNYRVPYAQTWNMILQQTLHHGLVVSLGYMGTKGTRLDLLLQPNRSAPGGSPLTAEQRRLIGDAAAFTYDTSIGNSIYHALDAEISRRFQKGMSASVKYVFSKAIDNSASFGGGIAQDSYNLKGERGVSGFDQRHNLSVSYYAVSPVGERGALKTGKWGTRLFSDWALFGSLSLASGTPLTARVLGNLSNTGGTIGSGRAEATGAGINEGPGFFNLLAFTIPPSGAFGDAGRDTITSPTRFGANLALSRSIKFGDGRRRVEFRFESSNFLNHVGYTSLGTVINASNYGLSLATAPMRSNTALLRFRF